MKVDIARSTYRYNWMQKNICAIAFFSFAHSRQRHTYTHSYGRTLCQPHTARGTCEWQNEIALWISFENGVANFRFPMQYRNEHTMLSMEQSTCTPRILLFDADARHFFFACKCVQNQKLIRQRQISARTKRNVLIVCRSNYIEFVRSLALSFPLICLAWMRRCSY